MVVLALTPNGLREALNLLETQKISVWCGADAISEAEFKALEGKAVSRFVHGLADGNAEALADAVGTIEEHHPGEIILVEHVPPVQMPG